MEGWRDAAYDLPDWHETGPAELRYEDGRVVVGKVEIIDYLTTDDDEIPLPEFIASTGEKLSIHDAKEWRPITP